MTVASLLLYITLFTSLFFEIVLLITYFEIRQELKEEKAKLSQNPSYYPTVSIVVPCYNEEKTVAATLHSLLSLDYPTDKLALIVVDDGSVDGTVVALKEFQHNPRVQIFSKENGGKHTAMNFALEKIDSELMGCLDADSFVDPTALKRIVPFFDDEATMAVTPSIKIHEPQTVLQFVQRVEYSWSVFLRRMLSSMNALYVTPGPFSIFRTKVFKEIGGYKHAYQTEDMEMALRMQRHGYKIANSHSAYVYTVAPAKLKSLLKQRTRWAYGFLNNAFDYRDMFFNRKYGNIGVFILPMATFSIFTTLYATGNLLTSLTTRVGNQITRYEAVGLRFSLPHWSLFGFNTGMIFWITLATVVLSMTILYLSISLTNGKFKFGKDIVYYLALYMFIVPLWLSKAVYSTIVRKPVSWR